jgi:hypothetical protein
MKYRIYDAYMRQIFLGCFSRVTQEDLLGQNKKILEDFVLFA